MRARVWVVAVAFVLPVIALTVLGVSRAEAKVDVAVQTPPIDPPEATREALLHAEQLVKTNPSQALTELLAAIRSPGFEQMSKSAQHQALAYTGQLAVQQKEYATAQTLLKRACEYAEADEITWRLRLSAAYGMHDYAEAGGSIAVIAKHWPQSLATIPDSMLRQIANRLGSDPGQSDLHFQLLDSLFDANWTDEDLQPSAMWKTLARALLDRGKVDKAVKVVARIDSTRAVIALLVDKRYDLITHDKTQTFDIKKMATVELERARARSDAAPDRLRRVTDLVAQLLAMFQAEQAIAICDAVIAKVRGTEGDQSYVDFANSYPWLLDLRSQALQHLGRWDEAVDQLRKAARRPEQGGANVSQAINLGMLYSDLGRGDEALDAISELGSVSPFGRMQQELLKLRVALQRNDKSAIETHLAFLREHRADAEGAYQNALLDTGQFDAAAEFLIERLRNPLWRNDALVEMQPYADVQKNDRDKAHRAHWREVVARSDVRNEMEKVGRILQDIPLTAPSD